MQMADYPPRCGEQCAGRSVHRGCIGKMDNGKFFDNVRDAVAYCLKDRSGPQYVFRGQRKPWPLRSSLFRIPEHDRENKWQETLDFCTWMLNNPYLAPYHTPEEKLMSIAQHYGYPTDFIDFTTDVKVAGFFSTDGDLDLSTAGVILVVNVDRFERLCSSYKVPGKHLFRIDGLWRLENQKGLFLRDYQDFFRQIDEMGYIDSFLEALLFRQNATVRISSFFPDINNDFIYPEPNDLEREIQRYEDIKLRSRPVDLESASTIHVERNPLGIDVEKAALEAEWQEGALGKWSKATQIRYQDYPRVDSQETLEIHFHDTRPATFPNTDMGSHVKAVQQFRSRVLCREAYLPRVVPIVPNCITKKFQAARAIEFSFNWEYEEFKTLPIAKNAQFPEVAIAYFLHLLAKNVQEILTVSTFLPYSDDQVAKAVQTCFSLLLDWRVNNRTIHEAMWIAGSVFGEHLVWLEYEDVVGVVSKCWAPSKYFDTLPNMTKVRLAFNRKHPDEAVESNADLFHYIHDIRKMMSLSEGLEFWAIVVLPWDILFRSKECRILSPYYVKTIGVA